MGAWGPKLYQCDDASDIADKMKEFVRIPKSGPELLQVLLEHFPYDDPDDETASINCIALADQFYLYGLSCPSLFTDARRMIESGLDDRNMAALDMSESDRAKRRKELEALLLKWERPNPKPRNRKVVKSPQKHVVSDGDIFTFPTEDQQSAVTNCSFKEIETYFKPNGWSAFLVGRTFHRLGVFSCAYCILLDMDQAHKPTEKDCLSVAFAGQFIRRDSPDPQPKAQWAPVTSNVLKKLRAEKIATVVLDPRQMQRHFNMDDPAYDPPAIHNALYILEVTVFKNKDEWLLRRPTNFRLSHVIAERN